MDKNLALRLRLHRLGSVRKLSFLLLSAGCVALCLPLSVREASAHPAPVSLLEEKPTEGHPTVHLDRLEFPAGIVGAPAFKEHLVRSLKREAYRADWGAGRENRIEYRFSVTELSYKLSDGALRIQCSAVGKLPGGQTAKSELTFGGSVNDRASLTKQVLEIVARGVITRLAELERRRRGLR
jgi:hypothetical protein